MIRFIKRGFKISLFAALCAFPVLAQQVKRTPFDVTSYVMDVSLSPSDRRLSATADVTFTPLEDTRAVAFELNGSLKVESVTRVDRSRPAIPVATAVRPTANPAAAATAAIPAATPSS